MAETRITGGEWRGRAIPTPPGTRVRPTRGMVRQALFNILGQDLTGWRVVDLYAGAGSVGLEALSRGASQVVFVERHAVTLRLIAANCERFGCADRVRLVNADAVTWLQRQPELEADLCFLDAPYRDQELDRALDRIGVLGPPLVVCEHHAARVLPDRLGRLVRTRTNTYGLTGLSLYRREAEASGT